MNRHAHLEIPGMIGPLVNSLAKCAQSSGQRRIFVGKPRPSAEVTEIEYQIVYRIGFVLERRGDGESFAALEKTKYNAPAGRSSIRLDEPEPSPRVGG
jgi:hypothetical protein